jgi:hypothetical protein
MISVSDVLQIISEIHQYSMLLIELKENGTVGITRSATDTMTCFKTASNPKRAEREALATKICAGQIPNAVTTLTVDEFLTEVEGKKTRHIWLESAGKESKEHAFLSISELKTFFRTHPHH